MLLAVFQFASLAMLGWLAAAAAPLLIHLLTRKRFRKVTWAAMEYLLAAMKKNQRRIQLEQWLLLAVRTALLVMLALALADPILLRANIFSFGGASLPTHHIFVVDATYSMDLRKDGTTRFEAAKGAIRETLQSVQQGDGFSLLLIADPPRVVIGEPAFAKEDLLEELTAATITHGLGDLPAMLVEVESIAAAARKQHTRLTASNIVVYSDLERTTWEEALSPAALTRWKKLAGMANVSVVDLGFTAPRNTAVVSAEVREAPVTIDRDFTIQAELAHWSEAGQTQQLATLVVDGEAVSQQSVTLDSGGRGAAAFRHRFSSPGDHLLEITLADDPLRVDNQRWLSVPVREALRALCVYSRPGEAKYVALALEPEKSTAVRVRVDEATDSAILEKDLDQYDAVYLINLPQIDAEQALALRSYVSAGGGLVVFPGDLTRLADFLPSEAPDQPPLLPAAFEALATSGNYRFTPLEYRHPLIAPFRGFERAGLLTAPTWKYVKLAPQSRAEPKTALAFDSGDPAIVEGRLGLGRVIVFATAASPESLDRSVDPPTPWSALATWPSFPPLVQESLSLVARGREEGRNRLVGESLSSLVRGASADTRATILPPTVSERRERQTAAPRQVRLESAGDVWRWSYGDTYLSGAYELKLGAPLNRTELFAVNIDPRESALERVDLARLLEEIGQPQATTSATSSAPASGTTQYAWFRPLLLAVVGLLLIESFLARWFGGGRA